jgi:hypothetical protein
MERSAALDIALTLLERPAAVRYAIGAPLPGGIALLLHVACGEADALRAASEMTGQTSRTLQEAAGFFIEQVLFHSQADHYRTLGAAAGASRSELRQHMALLIKWLHPDGRELRVSRSDLDRGIFINRVTNAWEALKTDDRRAAYDRSLAAKPTQKSSRGKLRRRGKDKPRPWRRPQDAAARKAVDARRFRRLVMSRFQQGSLFSRVFSSLWARL